VKILFRLLLLLFCCLVFGHAVCAQTITLTNGPPNLSAAMIPAGIPSGSPVSDVYADNVGNVPFTGTFNAPTGSNAGSFSISTATNCGSAGNITCGKLVTHTTGGLSAGTYNITLTTSRGGSQSVTINALSGTNVPCGSSVTVANTANSAGNGATLLFPSCTYNWTTSVAAPTNQTWVGIPGQTIFDAGGTPVLTDTSACGDQEMICGLTPGTTGVTIANLTFQHFQDGDPQPPYCGPDACGRGFAIGVNDGWTVRNTTVNGVILVGSVTQFNTGTVNYINDSWIHTGQGGLGGGSFGPITSPSAVVNVTGNEFGDMNYIPTASCNGSGNKWLYHNFTLNYKYNYHHDVKGPALWFDSFNNQHYNIVGNTFLRIGASAIQIEQQHTETGDYSFNVIDHSGDGSTLDAQAPACGGEGQAWPAIIIQGSANANIHDNNISVWNVTKSALHFYLMMRLGTELPLLATTRSITIR
jgi:hypothetical protein